MSSNGKTFCLFSDTSLVISLTSHVARLCHDLYVAWPRMELLPDPYFFILLGNGFSHIYPAYLFTSFLPFFVSFFFNLGGSNPPAISKMSIIVSLKKL